MMPRVDGAEDDGFFLLVPAGVVFVGRRAVF